MKVLNQYIDHTILKAEASEADIRQLCKEAMDNNFYAVCVNSCHVVLAVDQLRATEIKVAAVVGFPLGASLSQVKAKEAGEVARLGAGEVDMVINIGALKEGRYDFVAKDIKSVVEAADQHGAIVKVILETCLLTDEEIVKACQLSEASGAAFVKTSTGFSTGGATEHHVKLMRETLGNRLKIKASGGIRDKNKAIKMIEAGADRIGASASIEICK